MKEVVNELRMARRRKRISQKKLSAKLGYHKNSISLWERGKSSMAAVRLFDWAESLGYRIKLERESGWQK